MHCSSPCWLTVRKRKRKRKGGGEKNKGNKEKKIITRRKGRRGRRNQYFGFIFFLIFPFFFFLYSGFLDVVICIGSSPVRFVDGFDKVEISKEIFVLIVVHLFGVHVVF